jgi:hypothetical protein
MCKRWTIPVAAVLAVLCGLAGESRGQTNFQRRLYNLADYIGNSNYIFNPQGGGPLFNNNIYDQRIEWNRLGNGWTFDQFRFFGPDSFDNPNTIDLGVFTLQIGRDATLVQSPNPVGIHNTLGYTMTGIPQVTFGSQTGQRQTDVITGQSNFIAAPLRYIMDINTGIQNFQWEGNMLINTSGTLNMLGFYDITARVVNVGNATAEGALIQSEQVTDFDTGNINVTGNVVFDALGSLFQGIGLTTAATPFHILDDAAPKDKKTDELLARLKAGEQLTDEEVGYLLQQMVLAAFFKDPLGFLQNGMPDTVPGFEGLSFAAATESAPPDPAALETSAALQAAAEVTSDSGEMLADTPTVPEPGTLLFLAAAVGSIGALRSFRRRIR